MHVESTHIELLQNIYVSGVARNLFTQFTNTVRRFLDFFVFGIAVSENAMDVSVAGEADNRNGD